MSLSDRFSDERNTRTQAEIDDAETNVTRCDELEDHARDTFRMIARELAAMDLLDIQGLPQCDTADEAIEGAADFATDLFLKLRCSDRYKLNRKIADGDY